MSEPEDFVVAGVGYGMLEAAFDVYRPSAKLGLGVAGAALGLVTVVAASRLDHRLARSMLWQVPRHLIRLVLFTTLAHLIAAAKLSAPSARRDGALPGLELLRNPLYLAGLASVALLIHWVLTRERLRNWWHERLEALKLRPM